MKKIILIGAIFVAGIFGSAGYSSAKSAANSNHTVHKLTDEQKEALKKLKANFDRKVKALSDDIQDLLDRIRELKKSNNPRNKAEIDAIRKEIRSIEKDIYNSSVEFYKEWIRIIRMGNSTRP